MDLDDIHWPLFIVRHEQFFYESNSDVVMLTLEKWSLVTPYTIRLQLKLGLVCVTLVN